MVTNFFEPISEWSIASLAECLELNQAGTWGSDPNGDSNDYPVLRSTNIQNGNLILDEIAYRSIGKETAKRYELLNGDILVTKSSGSIQLVGKCVLFEHPRDGQTYLYSNFMQRLRVRRNIILPEYLYFYLRSPYADDFLERMHSTTSGLRNLDMKLYGSQQISLPPLPEQRRIVAILCEADEILRLRQQANEKGKQLYKNLFHHYFDADQKDADETEFIRLKELLAVPLSSGFSPISKDVPPGIAVFSLSAVTDFGLDETQIKYYPVKSYHGRGDDLEVDDILITRSNTLEFVGKVARYLGKPYPVIYPDLTIRIRLKNRKDSPYLENFLRSSTMISTIRKFARGTSGSMKKISQGDINDFDIYLPSIEKRYAYAELVEMIDKQIELQAVSLTKINTFYQSLLAQAFSGELTAYWREAHHAELEQAAEERDSLRKGLDGTTKAPPPQQPHESQITNRPELTKGLTILQTALLALIEEQDDTYFTATRVHGDIWLHMDEQGIYQEETDREGRYTLFAGLDCSLDTIRRELHFLARMGLVKELTLPVEEESGVGIVHYITTYRSLRADDDCQEQEQKKLKTLVEKMQV